MKKTIIASSLAVALGVTGVAGSVGGHDANAAQQTQFKYTVKSGDTLSEIGKKFNVSVSQLKQWNDLHSDIIIVDQKLTIYGQQQQQTQSQQVKNYNNVQYSQNAQSQYNNQATQSTQAYNQSQNVQQAPQQGSQSTQHAEQVRTQQAPKSTQTQTPKQTQESTYQAPKQETKQTVSNTTQKSVSTSGGSVKAQFLANGGTESAWNTIVMPESGGNPNAVNPLGYRGLGQTKESWGTGSVAQQTKGMINYANNRYGSLEAATAFRAAHGWW